MGHAVNEKPWSWWGVAGDRGLNVNVDVAEFNFELPGDSVSSLGNQRVNLLRLGDPARELTQCPRKGSQGSSGKVLFSPSDAQGEVTLTEEHRPPPSWWVP